MFNFPDKTLRRCTVQCYSCNEGGVGGKFSGKRRYVSLEWPLSKNLISIVDMISSTHKIHIPHIIPHVNKYLYANRISLYLHVNYADWHVLIITLSE